MPFTSYDTPSEFFVSGYSRVAGASGSITLTDTLTGLSDTIAGTATANTGDVRKILFRLLELFYNKYNNIPMADRPGKMTITRSMREDTLSTTGEYVRDFTVSFRTTVGTVEVAGE
jgi:hypothetical protein